MEKEKYYDKDRTKFEGEYLNGKGKEYYDNDKIKFEGEYLNGKRNGKAKEYYGNGKLKFEGQYYDDNELIGIKYNLNGDLNIN